MSNKSLNLLCILLLSGFLSACTLSSDFKDKAGGVDNSQRQSNNKKVDSRTGTRQKHSSTSDLNDAENANKSAVDNLKEEVNQTGSVPTFKIDQADNRFVRFAGQDVVELNYEQVDLRQIIEELADILDMTVMIDPRIEDKISMRTPPNRPLKHKDIWPVLKMLLAETSVLVERKGNVYHFKKSDKILPTQLGLANTLQNSPDSYVLQITPLKYISIEKATEVLTPVLTAKPEVTVYPLHTLNVMALASSPARLAKINQLLELVDADPFAHLGIKLFYMKNASAQDLATDLTEVLKVVEGENTTYQILPLDRINAIMVVAPPRRGFSIINRWVGILDAGNNQQNEQLFVYPVKHLTASNLAATLDRVFAKKEEPVATEEEAGEEGAEATEEESPGVVESLADLERPASSSVKGDGMSANISASIVADEATNSLLIKATPRDYKQLLETIGALDKIPLQVLINAIVAEVNLTDESKFGVDWTKVAKSLSDANQLPKEVWGTSFGALTSVTDQFLPRQGSGLSYTLNIKNTDDHVLTSTLNAIATDNDVSVLSRPSVVVLNNQEGQIKVGTSEPVKMGSTIVTGGAERSDIQYKDTGVILTITPQINVDGIINLKIAQEISDIIDSGNSSLESPRFTKQEIKTTIVVGDEETIIIGGLIQTDKTGKSSGVPVISEIPLIGGLFGYKQKIKGRRELILMIRPKIIDAKNRNAFSDEFRSRFQSVERLLKSENF